jgi:4-amino-4-deoxy-L-arabinose transferase-like glycosyltransferase
MMNSRNAKLFLRLAVLFIFSLGLHLAGTWILPLVDRAETWYAEVSREMNGRADFVVPHFNNRP